MADVRSLLRQQQAARRINHRLAVYTDGGKLSCVLCDELIKTESLWDTHLRSKGHRSRVQPSTMTRPQSGQKRHHQITPQPNNEAIADDTEDINMELQSPKKRARPDALDIEAASYFQTGQQSATTWGMASSVPRRLSGAPPLGVEITIASRPATPSRSGIPSSNSSTFDTTPAPASSANPAFESSGVAKTVPTTTINNTTNKDTPTQPLVAEDEWAAFEADIAATTAIYNHSTISAPAMAQEDVPNADAQRDDISSHQKEPASKQIQEDQEEATRQLETEFEDMEALEAQVRILKERREALRKHTEYPTKATEIEVPKVEDHIDDEDSSEDEDEDWAGFRFKGTIN